MNDLRPRPINSAAPAPDFPWPDGKSCALFVGFDVDAETAWLGKDPASVTQLVTMSYGGYEARVGIPKLLELLRRHEVKATFFITGWSVEAYPAICQAIRFTLAHGREIAKRLGNA